MFLLDVDRNEIRGNEKKSSDTNRPALPLSMFPSTHYNQDSVSLRAGDRLALYFDGLVEPESKAGKVFGAKRLSAVLESCREFGLSDARDCTIRQLERHSSGTPRADDQTLMLIEIG